MELFLFVLLIIVMLMGFLLYTAVAATFFFTVPLMFKEFRRRREAKMAGSGVGSPS